MSEQKQGTYFGPEKVQLFCALFKIVETAVYILALALCTELLNVRAQHFLRLHISYFLMQTALINL